MASFIILFIDACRDGNLLLAKELFSKCDDAKEYCYNAFYHACGNGHVHVAKWLLRIEPLIDVRADDDDAFRSACVNGYIKVAKWLLSVEPSIDVRTRNDEAFRWACALGDLKVAKWLQRLIPMLKDEKVKVFNNKRVLQLISFFN